MTVTNIQHSSVEELQVFNFNGLQLRAKLIDGEPWFIGVDACRPLDLKNPWDALGRLDEDDLGIAEVIDSLGRTQQMKTVNESGLYQLIFQSRTEGAKAFKKWVTSEVLPAIRKTGSYNAHIELPQSYSEALRELASTVEAKERLELENKALKPRAQAYEDFMGATGLISVKHAADLLTGAGIPFGRNNLFKKLNAMGWIYRDGGEWVPNEAKKRQGLITAKTQTRPDYASLIPGIRKAAGSKIHLTPKGLHKLREALLPPLDIQAVA